MPRRRVHLAPRPAVDDVDTAVRSGLQTLRDELAVPADFPPDVVAEAQAAAVSGRGTPDRADATDVELVTIDPPGSRDLDQAVHVERLGDGYRVRYAIADVAHWVSPGGAIDQETRRRVETLYAPDTRTPLHPPVLSEGAASLLPDQDSPALLWTIDLDATGAPTHVDVHRATVRSRTQLTYDEVQRALDDGTASPSLLLLREVGRLRVDLERARGGITLPTPEQEVERLDDGTWTLVSRSTLPIEDWNAQISLLTGMCAARLMLDARIGILRTLPAADPRDVARLQRSAAALGVPWPEGAAPGDVIRDLDASRPAEAALLTEATTLLRGAAYVAFDGTLPEYVGHGAIAAPYAHTTAPLRRLVDRYVGEVCVALSAGVEVPAWVRSALPDLPQVMTAGGRRASEYERGCLDLVEAVLLADRVGDTFDGMLVDVRDNRGVVQLHDPVVRARVDGDGLPLGTTVRVRLVVAEPAQRLVRFEVAPPA